MKRFASYLVLSMLLAGCSAATHAERSFTLKSFGTQAWTITYPPKEEGKTPVEAMLTNSDSGVQVLVLEAAENTRHPAEAASLVRLKLQAQGWKVDPGVVTVNDPYDTYAVFNYTADHPRAGLLHGQVIALRPHRSDRIYVLVASWQADKDDIALQQLEKLRESFKVVVTEVPND